MSLIDVLIYYILPELPVFGVLRLNQLIALTQEPLDTERGDKDD